MQLEKNTPVNPALSEFILSLIQAFLKTGYYMPEHPEAAKAKAGLYETLKDILTGKSEIAFLRAGESEKQEVFIAGILDEPVTASSLMMKSMGEIFIPKFIEYFERKNLSSFSIKADISKTEFEKFIAIMTESPLYEEKDIDSRERLSMSLIKNEVLMVSTVFNVDLVGKGRKLPWRVEISLSRLKKDLNMIPLYKNITQERINEIRKMVFEDIIRPLAEPTLIKEMLENLDLISSDLMGLKPAQFEAKIIEHLNERSLPAVAKMMLEGISGLAKIHEKTGEPELEAKLRYLRGMAKKIADKLVALHLLDEKLFLRFLNCGVVGEDEIPEDIRNKVAKLQSLEGFLESPEQFYRRLEDSLDAGQAEEQATLLFEFLPVVFRMGRLKEAAEILRLSRKKGIDFELAENPLLLERIAGEAYKRTGVSGKEEQGELLDILSSLGAKGTYLFCALLDCPSRFIRRQSIEALSGRGPAVVPFLLSRLHKKEGWYYPRNALMVLAKVGASGPEAESLMRRHLRHLEPNVRKEAIPGIANLPKEKAEGLLVPMLRDENPDVKKRAVGALGAIKSTSPELINLLVDVLTKKTDEDNPMQEQAINSIIDIGSPPPGGDNRIEDALLEMLKESSLFGLVGKKSSLSPQLKAGAIRALGSVGGPESLKTLKKYLSDPALSKAAGEAAEKIKKRQVA